jgi:hypothetical protein
MNKRLIYILISILSLSLYSCRVKKLESRSETQKIKISKEEELKLKFIEGIQSSYFDYNFLSAKAKVKVNRAGTDFTLTFNIRAQKDQKIWISANAIGGIEVARVLLTTDSVKILDKLSKRYIAGDYKYLSELLKTNVDFYMMQDLLFGNAPHYFNYKEASVFQNESTVQFNGVENSTSFAIDLRKEDLRLQRISLKESSINKRTVEVNYGGYKNVDQSNFPYLISSVASSQKESLSLNLEYVKVEKVNNLEFPFNVPKNFD